MTPDDEKLISPVVGSDAPSPTWSAILNRHEQRLNELGFELDNIPDPQDVQAFSDFLTELNRHDPVLAGYLVREGRQLAKAGTLPSSRASRRRERSRQVKRNMLMRQDGATWVYDKRKAPLYAIGAVILVAGPLMYFFGKPIAEGKSVLTASKSQKETGEGVSVSGETQKNAQGKKASGDGKADTQSEWTKPLAQTAAVQQAKKTATETGKTIGSAFDQRLQDFRDSNDKPQAAVPPPPVSSQSQTAFRPVQTPAAASKSDFGGQMFSAQEYDAQQTASEAVQAQPQQRVSATVTPTAFNRPSEAAVQPESRPTSTRTPTSLQMAAPVAARPGPGQSNPATDQIARPQVASSRGHCSHLPPRYCPAFLF